ncbi:MAG: hypothetical protein AB1Z19_06830 [Eubacteriales bacterium]
MTCWFCEKELAVDDKAFEVEMFGDVKQSQSDAEEEVSFNKKLVRVPRCASCKARQKNAKAASVFAVVFLVIALLALVAGWLNWGSLYIWGIVLGFSVGMIIEFLTVRGMSMKGIKSENYAKRRNKEITELKSNGYQFGRAPVQHKVNKVIIEEE